MSWTTLTEQDIADRLSAAEYTAFTSKFLRPGATSPLPGIIAGVVQEVRGYAAGNSSNALQDGSTIPPELTEAAIALCVYRLTTRLPVKQTDARKEAKDDALKLLDRVASGRFFISDADSEDLADSQPGGGVERVEPDGHTPSSDDLNGLV
jgi:hypothetical protein